MIIPADSVRKLPAGAVYERHNGRASLRVAAAGGGKAVMITGGCDSLEREVLFVKKENSQLRQKLTEKNSQEVKKQTEKKANYLRIAIICLIAGAIIGLMARWALVSMARRL